MNFKQLEVFVSVVKNRSFSRAAEEIFLSQPTVSGHILSLESECGARLLIRSTKEVCPTPAGNVFYQYANELLQMRDKALLAVKDCTTTVSGTLDIAASTVPAQYLLPSLLSQMAQSYPGLHYSLQEYDSCEVFRRIASMEAELGIVGTKMDDPRCLCQPFVKDRLVIITPNTPKFQALGGEFPLEMLKREPFLRREQGSGTRRETEEALSRVGIDPTSLRARAQLDGTESVKQAVAKGLGISIISRIAAEDYARFGLLLMFDLGDSRFDRQFYFVRRKDWPLSPAAEAFLALARQSAAGGKSS